MMHLFISIGNPIIMISGTKRLVAIKTRVRDLNASTPISEPGAPTGLVLPNGVTGYRFNIIGTIVLGPDLSENSATIGIDDGTGSLIIRSFERPELLEDLSPGQTVTIIGRPRQHADGISISPEIIKQTAPAWLSVRAKEIEHMPTPIPHHSPAANPSMDHSMEIKASHHTPNTPFNTPFQSAPPTNQIAIPRQPVEEEIIIEETQTPERRIAELIKTCDTGMGADAAEVLSRAKISNGDAIINKLLKSGDIFAVGAGRYKLLE